MRAAVLSILAIAVGPAVALADDAPAPEETAPLKFAVGADAHLGFGDFIRANIGARGELVVAPHHAIVVRAGVGSLQWMDSEYDDPTYREWFARVGYRLSSTRVFGGVELGRSMYQARWDAFDGMPARKGEWFGETTATLLAGLRLGPVDLGLDYTRGSEEPRGSVTVFVGAGYRQP